MVHLAMAHGRPQVQPLTLSAYLCFDIYNSTQLQRPLFDCAIIVQFKTGRVLDVLYQFPDAKTDRFLASVPEFCFPDKNALDLETITFISEESFSFALTSDDGERRLGYCRRILGKPTLCYCVVSAL